MRRIESRRPTGLGVVFLAIVLLLVAPAIEASRVRSLNLEQMTERAGHVFHGRCVQVRVIQDADLDRAVTLVTFEVERAVKGSPDSTETIKLFGNQTAGSPEPGLLGLPRFVEGEELVLFLYPDSELGLTSPVGLGQGKFSIVHDKAGRPVALNPQGNQSLFRRLSVEALDTLGPEVLAPGAPLSLAPDALLDMVEALQSGRFESRRDAADGPSARGSGQ